MAIVGAFVFNKHIVLFIEEINDFYSDMAVDKKRSKKAHSLN